MRVLPRPSPQPIDSTRPGPPCAEDAPDRDGRCLCGSLVARFTDRGVELKCRRCKRTLLIPCGPPDEPGRSGAKSFAVIPVESAG